MGARVEGRVSSLLYFYLERERASWRYLEVCYVLPRARQFRIPGLYVGSVGSFRCGVPGVHELTAECGGILRGRVLEGLALYELRSEFVLLAFEDILRLDACLPSEQLQKTS